MKRRIVFLMLSFCGAIALVSFTRNDQDPQPKAAIRTLIIDPGHGGIDPGAKGSFSTEADVSLAVSLKLGKAIQKEFPELKVVYTRTTDVMAGNKPTKDQGLKYRADLANESAGDLFIAVHCNSAGHIKHKQLTGYVTKTVYKGKGSKRKAVKQKVPQYKSWTTPNPARGTETYIWAVNKNDAKINSMNQIQYYGEIDSTDTDSHMTLQLPDPSDPAEKARMFIYAQQFFRKSLNLAEMIEKEFAAAGRVSRGVKQRNDAGIWVLQATNMPSILVEIGFISNKEEEEYLNSEKGQDEIVQNIVTALKNYKDKLESRSVAASGAAF